MSILLSKVGGTLDNTGSTGVIALNNGTLRDATIAAGSTVTTGANLAGVLENTLINHGTLFPSTGEVIFIASDTTLSGGGVVALPDTNSKIYNLGSNRTLTNTDNVLRGGGQIGYDSLSVINGPAGIIQADISGLSLRLNGSGTFTNNGLFAARNGGTLLRASGTFTNFSGSTLTGGAYLAADSTLNLNIGPIVFNAASVILSGPNSIFTPIDSIRQNDGIFEITEGRNFSVLPLPSMPDQQGSDNGTSNAFTNAGTLVVGPDSSFTVNGDYSQGIDSALDVVLSEANDDPNFHQLNVTGTASLAGKLEVTLADGYTPPPDQTFEIVHAGAIAGNFLEVVGGTVTYTSTGVFINLNTVPDLELSGVVSRKAHGVAGTFDLPLVLSPAGNGTVEPRANGPTTIVFAFNRDVAAADGMISANEFTITNAAFSSASITGKN